MKFRVRLNLLLVSALALGFMAAASGKLLAAPTAGLSLTTSPVTLGLNVKPGQTESETLKLMNNTTQPLKIQMAVKTFGSQGTSGDAAITNFPTNDPAQYWVHISPSTFTAQPGVWSKVQATISLPAGASLGYYYAIVFQPITANPILFKSTAIKGSNAILMLLNTNSGNEQRQVQVADFSVNKKLFEYLPANFSVNIRNNGNIYLAASGDIFISRHANGTGTIATLPINSGGGNILPASNRIFTSTWADGFPVFVAETKNGQPVVNKKGNPVMHLHWNFARANHFRFGRYYARLALTYNDGRHQVLLNSVVSFWVIPWKLLFVLLVILAIILFGFWSIGRSTWRKFRAKHHK